MIDFLLLIFLLFVGSKLAKLSISETTYKTIRNITFFSVLVGSLLILNNPVFAELSTTIARLLDGLEIGNPFAWRIKSSEFRNEIEGCYYLMFLGVIIYLLAATGFEHKDLEGQREKDGITTGFALFMVFLMFYWLFFTEWSLSSGAASEKIRYFYNSQILLIGWEWMFLLLARDSGKIMRVFFEKKTT